jgi:hypothetical protein
MRTACIQQAGAASAAPSPELVHPLPNLLAASAELWRELCNTRQVTRDSTSIVSTTAQLY